MDTNQLSTKFSRIPFPCVPSLVMKVTCEYLPRSVGMIYDLESSVISVSMDGLAFGVGRV